MNAPEQRHPQATHTDRPRPSWSHWLAGARPRTLPAAIAPVLVGTAAAIWAGSVLWGRAALCLAVAMALQVGVNYANDYSDGIRGTDARRVGPVRLVGQGLAAPAAVKRAALISFTVAAACGLLLVVLSQMWVLLAVGVAAILSAWTYTGGPKPYGYAGLGEVFVFVFFGLVAVCGTVAVQVGSVDSLAWVCGVGVGALSCAILVTNNLRDIPGDTACGKRTLAVRLGDPRTRTLYLGLVALGLAVPLGTCLMGLAQPDTWPRYSGFGLLAAVAAWQPVRLVRSGADGPRLIPALVGTGRTLLVYGVTFAAGIALSAL